MNAHSPREKPSRREHSLRAQFRAATKNAILAAAEQAFAADGLHGARMEDIASRAGCAVGTVYNYFADRQTLAEALLASRRSELLARVDAALAEKRSFRDKLEAFTLAMADHVDEHRAIFTLLFHEELAGKAKTPKAAMRELLARAEVLVAAGIAEKALRRDDRELYSWYLIGMLRAGVMRALASGPDAKMRDLVAPTVRFFLEGAGAKR